MYSFVETPLFSKLVLEYLSDDEYLRLQQTLIHTPESGVVIRGSGGIRKLRWAAPGQGKRGRYRVIYYLRKPKGVVWMLTMYPKNVADSLSTNLLKQIREEIEND